VTVLVTLQGTGMVLWPCCDCVSCRTGHRGAAAVWCEWRVSITEGSMQTPLTTSPCTSPLLSELILGFRHRHHLQHLQRCSSGQVSRVQSISVSPRTCFTISRGKQTI